MSYEKYYPNGWQSGEIGGTPITPEALNHMEEGILNSLPATESTSHPGCYYRVIDGSEEWINPPLDLGVEYRTTERYNGKVVYTKLVNFGNLPASGRVYVDAVTFSVNVIELTGVATFGNGYEYPFPMVDDSTGAFMCGAFIYNGTTTSIGVYANTSLSGATAKFKMKYTKD